MGNSVAEISYSGQTRKDRHTLTLGEFGPAQNNNSAVEPREVTPLFVLMRPSINDRPYRGQRRPSDARHRP